MKTIKINPIHEAHSALSVVRHVRRISRGGGIKTLTSLARSPLPRSAHRPLCKTRGHRLPAVREIDKFTGSISIVIATYVLSMRDRIDTAPLWILFFATAGGRGLPERWKRAARHRLPPYFPFVHPRFFLFSNRRRLRLHLLRRIRRWGFIVATLRWLK